MTKKAIPAIHVPIQKTDGSMEWVWYMFLSNLATEGAGNVGDGRLTFIQDGVIIGEFSANQQTDTEVVIEGTANIDGGFANSVYTEPQHIDGGGANGQYYSNSQRHSS